MTSFNHRYRLTPQLDRAIQDQADMLGISRSEMVRFYVIKGLFEGGHLSATHGPGHHGATRDTVVAPQGGNGVGHHGATSDPQVVPPAAPSRDVTSNPEGTRVSHSYVTHDVTPSGGDSESRGGIQLAQRQLDWLSKCLSHGTRGPNGPPLGDGTRRVVATVVRHGSAKGKQRETVRDLFGLTSVEQLAEEADRLRQQEANGAGQGAPDTEHDPGIESPALDAAQALSESLSTED